MVPDEASDDSSAPDSSDPQAMSSDALGDLPDRNAEDDIDQSAGDEADATSQGHSGGARGSEASLGRHDPSEVDEDDQSKTLED